jgi:hypothetical protein
MHTPLPCDYFMHTVGAFLDFTARENVFMLFFFQLYSLRKLKQGPENEPKAPLGNNARPFQPLNHRTVRTNIDFSKKAEVRIERGKC